MKKQTAATSVMSLSFLLMTINTFSLKAMLLAYLLAFGVIFLNIRKILRARLSIELAALTFLMLVALSTGVWGGFYLNNFVKLLGLILYAAAIICCFRVGIIRSESIVSSCNFIICAHSLIFSVQLVYWFLTGEYLNITNYVRDTEADALYLSNALENTLFGMRGTGVYTEPSFYAMTVLSAAACVFSIKRKLTLYVGLAMITACMSFSVAGIVITGLLLILVLYSSNETKKTKLAVVLVAVSIAPLFYAFFQEKIVRAADYDAIASRLVVINEIAGRNTVYNLFGSGMLWDDRELVGKNLLTGYHIRDSSFYVYLLFTGGVFSVFALFLYMLYMHRRDPLVFYVLAALLLFKFHVLNGVFWLAMVFLYLSSLRYQQGSQEKIQV